MISTVTCSDHFTDDLVPLFSQVVCVVGLHVLLEVADVGEPAAADWTDVFHVLADGHQVWNDCEVVW